jgi:hypothetical protein
MIAALCIEDRINPPEINMNLVTSWFGCLVYGNTLIKYICLGR